MNAVWEINLQHDLDFLLSFLQCSLPQAALDVRETWGILPFHSGPLLFGDGAPPEPPHLPTWVALGVVWLSGMVVEFRVGLEG